MKFLKIEFATRKLSPVYYSLLNDSILYKRGISWKEETEHKKNWGEIPYIRTGEWGGRDNKNGRSDRRGYYWMEQRAHLIAVLSLTASEQPGAMPWGWEEDLAEVVGAEVLWGGEGMMQ